MRQILFIITAGIAMLVGKVWAQTYTMTKVSQDYLPLTNDTTIASGSNLAGKAFLKRIPFPIRVGNQNINNLYLHMDGFLGRKVTQSGYTYYSPFLFFYGNCGLQESAGDSSKVSYVVEGETPNRIAKIQFKSIGFIANESGEDKINVQIWLYEGAKKIEILYGPSTINVMRALNGAYGPLIGLGSQYLRGPVASPTVTANATGVNGTPQNGVMFRFTRP